MIVLRVKEVATAKGVSMNRLSRLSDVSLPTLQKIYHDPHQGISLHTLDRLAQALQCDPRDLFEYFPEEK